MDFLAQVELGGESRAHAGVKLGKQGHGHSSTLEKWDEDCVEFRLKQKHLSVCWTVRLSEHV